MLGWRAWSHDSQFDSRLHSAEELPDTLQFVVAYMDDGRRVMWTGARSDLDKWYVFLKDRVVADEGPFSEVMGRWPHAVVKKGTWTSDANYDRICKEAWVLNWDGTPNITNPPRQVPIEVPESNCGCN